MVSLALDKGHAAIATLLIHNGAAVKPKRGYSYALARAAELGDPGLVEMILARGAAPNPPEGKRRPITALHRAVSAKHHVIVKLLLKHGARVNVQDYNGNTPLHNACSVQWASDMVKLLLKHGADVRATDNRGSTPLHSARDGYVAALLIEKGADIRAQNKAGHRPIHYALNASVVQELINRGADVNATAKNGDTPLHRASDPQVVNALVRAGSKINSANNKGWTPLHHHAWWGNSGPVIALLHNRADTTLRDKDDKTPAQVARRKNIQALFRRK